MIDAICDFLMLGFEGTTVPDWLYNIESEHGLGGVILFGDNIESPEQLKILADEIHSMPSHPLVFVDQEGGMVARLSSIKGFEPFCSEYEFNKLSLDSKKQLLDSVFSEMSSLGIDYDLAPVIDLHDQDNPNIGAVGRAYSESIGDVRENAKLMSEYATKHGVGLCLKHFPGIGAATEDSHKSLMHIATIDEASSALFYELAPNCSGNSIMISHAVVDSLDSENPISASPKGLKILREHCPNTLLISDSLEMEGFTQFYGLEDVDAAEILAKPLRAGTDLLCMPNNPMTGNSQGIADMIARLKSTLESGMTDDLHQQLEDSRARIKARKEKF